MLTFDLDSIYDYYSRRKNKSTEGRIIMASYYSKEKEKYVRVKEPFLIIGDWKNKIYAVKFSLKEERPTAVRSGSIWNDKPSFVIQEKIIKKFNNFFENDKINLVDESLFKKDFVIDLTKWYVLKSHNFLSKNESSSPKRYASKELFNKVIAKLLSLDPLHDLGKEYILSEAF